MRTLSRIVTVILLLGAFSIAQNTTQDKGSFQLEQFVGTWEIRKSPTTGRVNLTVIIVREGDTIGGMMNFVHPDGTTTQCRISRPEFKGTTVRRSLVAHKEFKGPKLDFQTQEHKFIMYWSLTLTKPTRGFLRGDKRELSIEEEVSKQR